MLSFLIALAIVITVTVGTNLVFNLTAGRRYDAELAEVQKELDFYKGINR